MYCILLIPFLLVVVSVRRFAFYALILCTLVCLLSPFCDIDYCGFPIILSF